MKQVIFWSALPAAISLYVFVCANIVCTWYYAYDIRDGTIRQMHRMELRLLHRTLLNFLKLTKKSIYSDQRKTDDQAVMSQSNDKIVYNENNP